MKNPNRMSLKELLSLPTISSRHILDRAEMLGGCFKDRNGELWGTCLLSGGTSWARYQAVGDLASVMDEFSSLRGFIDYCDGARLEGWAQDDARPNEVVDVEVVVDGKPVARARADLFRSDLLAEKIGDGHHGFSLKLPKPLSADASHRVVMQRFSDGAFINMATVLAKKPTPAAT